MLVIIAVFRSRVRTGIRNVRATMSFVKNVENVAVQIFFCDLFFSDSSAMWIPNASESASAIAIVRIPAMIIVFEPVLEFSPIINPRVVITPEVNPNPIPFFIGSFMGLVVGRSL